MVGITERGDAGLDFSWIDKLNEVEFAILITKNVNPIFIEQVLKHKDKLIIHCTITGLYQYEPNVPHLAVSYRHILQLIIRGFPVEQLVLRVDPIIPTAHDIDRACKVLELFKDTGIKRVRYSYLDLYPHVRERFIKANIMPPYDSFTAPKYYRDAAYKRIHEYDRYYEFESCAEDNCDRLGCISKKDYDIMHIPYHEDTYSSQRRLCTCVNKRELLDNCTRCNHKCLYCYWKDKE